MAIIYTIMIILGFMPFVISLYRMKKTKKLKDSGVKTTAVVKQLYGSSSKGMNRVLIQYRTRPGDTISKEIIVGGTPYSVGDSLPMFYNPINPMEMELDAGKSYIVIVIFTLLLAAFMIAACFMIQNSIDKGEI